MDKNEFTGLQEQDTDYGLLLRQAEAFAAAEKHMVPLLANVSALLNDSLSCINWVGFYLVTRENALVLGPFQGKTACIHIARGKGVCGTAFAEGKTVCVRNVHDFPGHIACDQASLSEIVVPVKDRSGAVRAVLDIDSPIEGRFFARDRDGLEKLCVLLGQTVLWKLQ